MAGGCRAGTAGMGRAARRHSSGLAGMPCPAGGVGRRNAVLPRLESRRKRSGAHQPTGGTVAQPARRGTRRASRHAPGHPAGRLGRTPWGRGMVADRGLPAGTACAARRARDARSLQRPLAARPAPAAAGNRTRRRARRAAGIPGAAWLPLRANYRKQPPGTGRNRLRARLGAALATGHRRIACW